MPTRGSSGFIAPSIHSLYKPPFSTQLHCHTPSLLVTMAGRPYRRGCRNTRRLDFSPDYVPEAWLIINETNEGGVEERYINTATNEIFYSREDMLRYFENQLRANRPAPAFQPGRPLDYCTRCRSVGHGHIRGFSEEYVRAINALYPIPAAGPAPAPAPAPAYGGGEPAGVQRATYWCGLCHRYGQNARTCRVLL